MKATLVTIVNNREIYAEFVNNLYEQENIDYCVMPIWNDHDQHSSARIAFNSVMDKIESEYVVFLHPDIRFLDKFALRDIFAWVDKLPQFGVCGCAGACKGALGRRDIMSSIVHGLNKRNVGMNINVPKVVQTLDECFFLVKTEYYKKHPFPNVDGWHLYGVQYCLQANKEQLNNYVIPARIWHMSDGKSLDYKYVMQLMNLAKEERPFFDVIYTTVRKWEIRSLKGRIKILAYFIKQYIKQFIKK